MRTLAMFTSRRAKFEAFLTERGAQILQPTNEWELLRFKTSRGTSVVYCNSKGGITPTGESDKAWGAFEKNAAWRGAPAPHKRPRKPEQKTSLFNALMKRDGKACFFCFVVTTEEDRSLEHLVPLSHGGPNHLSNFVIACIPCNTKAGHMSAMEKIRMREANRGAQ
ncbi:HNH endonuclease [Paraburkholderia metrosideri]|uniref:HNH endonuclease n=1 Tax=Paraburkholderia metrosideri TaxID=580937 RepID=A0ABW9DVP6_9BURK